MISLIRPQGDAVVGALKRYDPNIDVRYSWQKRSWAITIRPLRPDLIPPPVRYSKSAGEWIEERLAERSEANIAYRTKTMPIGFVKRLSRDILRQVIEMDSWAKGKVETQIKKMQESLARERRRIAKDRWKEARGYMNWHARTHPMAA